MLKDTAPRPLAIALAGGNALGAFQAGALSVLARSGRPVALVTGVSIGSVNAVLFSAARNGDPEATLRQFWMDAAQDVFAASRTLEEFTATISALLMGRPTLSRGVFSLFPSVISGRNALQDASPLAATLERLVDFGALAQPSRRLWVGATALAPDEPVIFGPDDAISVAHILASCALPVLFPPVRIGERVYVDGGVSANLLLHPLLVDNHDAIDCIALDLFARGGPIPNTLDAAAERLQSLTFAFQSERTLAAVEAAERDLRLFYASYRPAERESAGKTLDFSRRSIEARWQAGEEAMTRALEKLDDPSLARGVHRV